MKIFDLLSKLGIYRQGVNSWKGSAKNRTMPFIDDSIMNPTRDYSTVQDLRQDGQMAMVLTWVFGTSLLLLGLLIVSIYLASGLIMILLGLLLLPPLRLFLNNKFHFRLSGKLLMLIIVVGIVFALMLVGSNPVKKHNISLSVREGKATEEGMKNLTLSLAQLATEYKAAVDYQNVAATIPYGSLNVQDARLIVAGAQEKWKAVETAAEGLEKLKFSVITNEGSYFDIITTAYAQGVREDMVTEQPLKPGEIGQAMTDAEKEAYEKNKEKSETFARQELIRQKWEQADLARQAYPDKKWLTIVQMAFKEDAQSAKKRLDERNSQLQIEFKDEADYNKRWVQGLTVAQTGGKVVLFVAAMPEAAAATGAVAATEAFLTGVDVAFSVGDSVNVMMNDGAEPLAYTQAKDAVAPLLMMTSVKAVLQNPSEWKKETILSLYDVGALTYNQGVGFTVFNGGEAPNVEYYDQSIQDVFGPEGTGNELLPSNLKFKSKEQRRKQINEAAGQFIERLKDPEYRQALLRLEEDRIRLQAEVRAKEQKEKQIQSDQARKDVEIQKIMERKEAERARAANRKESLQKLKQLESTMPKSEAISPKLEPVAPQPVPVTPAPTPVKTPVGTTVGSCSLCAQSGLDCACGRAACRCCAPGDENCNAYDL